MDWILKQTEDACCESVDAKGSSVAEDCGLLFCVWISSSALSAEQPQRIKLSATDSTNKDTRGDWKGGGKRDELDTVKRGNILVGTVLNTTQWFD